MSEIDDALNALPGLKTKFKAFVDGGETTEVVTESGTWPSIVKYIHDTSAATIAALKAFKTSAETANTAAQTAKNTATTKASEATAAAQLLQNAQGQIASNALNLSGANSAADRAEAAKVAVEALDVWHTGNFDALSASNVFAGATDLDPNTTDLPYFVSNHANVPPISSGATGSNYYYVTNNFYLNDGIASNRGQTARSYRDSVVYYRSRFLLDWSPWVRCDNGGLLDEVAHTSAVFNGVNGIAMIQSKNIASIIRQSAGLYLVHFIKPMSNDLYNITVSGGLSYTGLICRAHYVHPNYVHIATYGVDSNGDLVSEDNQRVSLKISGGL